MKHIDNTMPTIRKKSRIALEYSCFDDQGNELDNSGGDFEVSLGQGALLPALERHLVGHHAGDSLDVTLPPCEAFGERDESLYEFAPMDSCQSADDTGEINAGDVVQFCPEDGGEFYGVASIIYEDGILLDMNHPLAGKTLTYKLHILEIIKP